MRDLQTRLLSMALSVLSVSSVAAQQQITFEQWTAPFPAVAPAGHPTPTVPDSVRRKIGYQHWKGATIGAGVGAVFGSVFAFGVAGRCADCTVTTWDRTQLALVMTGLSTGFGFLVGLASPKYVWEAPLEPSGAQE
jgi:hypothetical protein